jgi:predicted RNase H-like HicB family nuclease
MTHYIALIHKDADSGYGVSFPDVPGVTVVADTLDEALHEAGIALGFAFEDWNGALPTSRNLDELRRPGFSKMAGRCRGGGGRSGPTYGRRRIAMDIRATLASLCDAFDAHGLERQGDRKGFDLGDYGVKRQS